MTWKPAAECAPAIRGERRNMFADRIARLAAAGSTDRRTATALGISYGQVRRLREAYAIPAACGRGRPFKGVPILGRERAVMATDLAARYRRGASIQRLAEQTGRSHGWIHTVLTEAGVEMKPRGGYRGRRTRSTPKNAPTGEVE